MSGTRTFSFGRLPPGACSHWQQLSFWQGKLVPIILNFGLFRPSFCSPNRIVSLVTVIHVPRFALIA